MGKAACLFVLGVTFLVGCRAETRGDADRADGANSDTGARNVAPAPTDAIDAPALPPSRPIPITPEESFVTTAPFDGSSDIWTPAESFAYVPADWTSLTLGTSGFTSPVSDSLDLGLFEPEDAPALLSLYVSSLALELIEPLGAGNHFDLIEPTSDVAYLEQICRDSGQPDHVCRQLYGY